MHTPLAQELGLEFPIFAFTHCRDVAAAVSKAGGLGVLGIAGHSAKNLKMELEWIENEVGDKPFGVDLLLPTRFAGSDRGGLDSAQMDQRIPEEHRKFLDELLEGGSLDGLVRHLPGLPRAQMKHLAPVKIDFQRKMSSVEDGFHGLPS